MQVTVVMPVYREKEEFVRQAIESILNQTLADFKYIIILDDPDNYKLQQVIDEYCSNDERIAFYINDKNMGCPLTKNKGVTLSTTEYVAIMDADDISYHNRLEVQLLRMQNSNIDFLAGYVDVIDEENNVLYTMDKLPIMHEDIVKKMRINNCMPHPAWFFKKKTYMALGGYADIQGCEDYDLLIRAINQGYRLGNCDQLVLRYRLSKQSISRDNLYKQYLMMQYIQDKYFYHRFLYDSYQEYESQKYTDKKAKKYSKAADAFQEALICKKQNKYYDMLKSLSKILVSKEYIAKIMRYLWETMV